MTREKYTLNDTVNPHSTQNWKIRYVSIFTGQALSIIGSSLTQFILIWWITDMTGSVASLATAGIATFLPNALLSPLGGALADKYNRRLLMILSDGISSLCIVVLLLLFAMHSEQVIHVYVIIGIRSVMQAFQGPASAASVAMLVPGSFIARAAGLNELLFGVVTIVSAPLGAFVVSVMPMEWTFSIDIITALLGIIPLLFFKIPQLKPGKDSSGLWSFFMEGFNMVWQNSSLRHLYLLIFSVVLLVLPTFTFLPLLVKEHFKGGAREVAWMEGVAGLCMITGSIAVTFLAPKKKIPWILCGFAVSAFSLSFTALATPNRFWIAIIWWSLSAVGFIFANASLTVVLQTVIPNQMQGRALSLLNTVMGLAAPIGLLLATPLGEAIGIRWLFIIVGVLGGFLSLIGFFSGPLKNI